MPSLAECLLGHHRNASERLREAIRLFAKIGDRGGAAYTIGELGLALSLEGDAARADFLLASAEALSSGSPAEAGEGAEGSAPIGPIAASGGRRSSTALMLERAAGEARDRGSPEWRKGRAADFAAAVAAALESPPG